MCLCSERLYKQMADILVNEGYRDVGYEYVIVDDCWSNMNRDPITHRLLPDLTRFPNGIAYLADYVRNLRNITSNTRWHRYSFSWAPVKRVSREPLLWPYKDCSLAFLSIYCHGLVCMPSATYRL
jgi:3',5'-cyclic AMP phosphodiesterase CpdA